MAPKQVPKKAASQAEPEKKEVVKRKAEEKEEPARKEAKKDAAATPSTAKAEPAKASPKAEQKPATKAAAAKKEAAPKAEAKKEAAPKAEAKKEAAPKAEAKKEAAPKAEAKKEAAPKAELKKEAAPKAEAKKEAAPKEAAPKAEPKKEEPVEESAKVEEVEVEKEKEKDAPADKRPTLKENITFYDSDCTLNVVPTVGGKVLMALSDGGMQYLIAGARANVGVKAGRYLYEVRIIETLTPAESLHVSRGRLPAPRQLVRLGFSTAGSPVILGDSEDGIYFDSEGFYGSGKKRVAASQRFTRDQVIGVLLNLDPKSPNANTISLFRDGERISEPQALPEQLHGKVLYPHIAFRSVTVQVLLGPEPAKPLPFKCRTLQGAAQADVVVKPQPEIKDGKYEVVLPIGFPDEGTFDWLDTFLEKNPQYVELSDRKIVEWATSSGLAKPKAKGWKSSNDKPEFNYGLPGMDDFSVRRVLYAIAPVVPRNYVVMEVRSNLLASERKEALKKFSAPHFKRVAHVVMGEPTEDYKEMQRAKMLKDKQDKADVEWRVKKLEEERRHQIELRQKQLQEMKLKAEEQRKKAAAAAAAAVKEGEAAEEAKEGEEAKGSEEAKAEEAAPMDTEEAKEEGEEEKAKQEDEEEEAEEEKKDVDMTPAGEGPPKVELTEEEQKLWFRPQPGQPDLTPMVLSQAFPSFTLPDKEEGFDEIRYEWQKEQKAKDYLKDRVLEKKVTTRIEDLQPSKWFREKYAAWQKLYQEWQQKHEAFKAAKAKEEKKPAAEEEKKAEGEEGAADEEKKEAAAVDIFSVENVSDVGNGEPLFANFAFEDWALLQLRYELYLLQLAFKQDVNDPERLGIHESHLAFYYNKYFRKTLSPKFYGLNTNNEVVDLVKDTVTINAESKVLTSSLPDEPDSVDIFVKLAEENRRERQRRIDAGDETNKLKFAPMTVPQVQTARPGVGAGGSHLAISAGGFGGAPRGINPHWQPRPHQQWGQAPRGGGYRQTGGYQPRSAGRWPPAASPYAPRQPFAQQKWR